MADADRPRQLRARLEHGEANPGAVVAQLITASTDAPTRTERLDACLLLGDLAGRALGADWETAEHAAFALLEAARLADTAADRRGVITAMGRAFHNLWLLPFVHRRLSDRDPTIVVAALHAAGGLGFPALEESVAEFLADATPPAQRRAAIAALGRMGAMSIVDRLVPFVLGDAADAAAALAALTEIRSPVAREAALGVLDHDLEPELQIAAVRYLAELGAVEVVSTLRRLARHDAAEIRLAANLASRALKAERSRDAAERFLIALSEPDRAVRSVLARRLRTLAVGDVLDQAEILLGDDAAGVVQILGELREPEVTRYLLALGHRPGLPAAVRARAVGSIEANLPWERDELAKLAHKDPDDNLRSAAIQALAAFATTGELIDRVGSLATSPSPIVRGALLWGLQLAARPQRADGPTLGAALPAVAALVGAMLDDPDPTVRRRAAYVAGNLALGGLAAALVARCAPDEPDDLRLAAYVALGELGMPGVVADVVAAVHRERDPRVLGAAANALVATLRGGSSVGAAAADRASLTPLAARAQQLITAGDARLREAGAEIAGLLAGAVPAAALAPLLGDPAPAVRGAAVAAIAALATSGDPDIEALLLAAFRDDDPAVHERAAAGLLQLGSAAALAQAIAFASGDGDPIARATIAVDLAIPPAHAAALAPAIDAALARTGVDDPAFEPLLRVKLAARTDHAPPSGATETVDLAIAAAFPSFAQLVKLPGFDPMVRSLRTAESLFQTIGHAADADLSPPIMLWMKVLENYVHAWLGPRLAGLQREPATLFDYVDHVIGASWPSFQRWLEPKWAEHAEVGGARVEIPLRAIPNAVRELADHRRKRLDSPLSVTEWARLIVLFAIDHTSGFRNMMRIGTGGARPERTVSLAHRLHTLAAVRNLVTHRMTAGASTLSAFRHTYYVAFEELVGLT